MSSKFIAREKCPGCGSSKYKSIFSLPYNAEPLRSYMSKRHPTLSTDLYGETPYEIALCNRCTLVYQTYVPSQELSEEIYAGERQESSLRKKVDSELSFFVYKARECERVALMRGKKPSDIRLLEFGSGWGRWLFMAKAFGYDVTGIEVIPERIQYAKENGLAVFDSLEKITGTFDYIYTDQVFEHLDHPTQELKKLVALLNKDGILEIHVPNGNGLKKKLSKPFSGKPYKEIEPFAHINCFTHGALTHLATQADLSYISPWAIAKKILRHGLSMRNLGYLQEALRAWWRQRFSTNLYFEKR